MEKHGMTITEAELDAIEFVATERLNSEWSLNMSVEAPKLLRLVALARLAAQWQPIETAPKDGTPILGYARGYPDESKFTMEVMAVIDGEWINDVGTIYAPTHWMPLPPSPSMASEERKEDDDTAARGDGAASIHADAGDSGAALVEQQECEHDLRIWRGTPDGRCIKCGINVPAVGEPYFATVAPSPASGLCDLVKELETKAKQINDYFGYPMQRAAAMLERQEREVERLRQLDAEAATHVESVICMRTHFTGEPPYVGWKGLGLALTETLDRHEASQARVKELEAVLDAARIVLKNRDQTEAEAHLHALIGAALAKGGE